MNNLKINEENWSRLVNAFPQIAVLIGAANGYMTNLENLLACVDDFTLGVKAQVRNGEQAKAFLPCVQFTLPKKSKVGPTLQKFYGEIESYESKISDLSKKPSSRGARTKSPEQLKEKIKELEDKNKELKAEIRDYKSQLSQMSKAEATANKALMNQNILPPNIRLASVRSIDLKERLIVLKSGRTNINFPMVLTGILPEIDEKCLVYIDQGRVRGGFCYEGQGKDIKPSRGEVVFSDSNVCKIRDPKRKIWRLEAKHEAERAMFAAMKRGDEVLMYMLDGQLIRLQDVEQTMAPNYEKGIMEEIAKYHLDLNLRKP